MNALSLGGEEWHVVAGYGPEAARSPARDAAKTRTHLKTDCDRVKLERSRQAAFGGRG
jgi:hypothetical protein